MISENIEKNNENFENKVVEFEDKVADVSNELVNRVKYDLLVFLEKKFKENEEITEQYLKEYAIKIILDYVSKLDIFTMFCIVNYMSEYLNYEDIEINRKNLKSFLQTSVLKCVYHEIFSYSSYYRYLSFDKEYALHAIVKEKLEVIEQIKNIDLIIKHDVDVKRIKFLFNEVKYVVIRELRKYLSNINTLFKVKLKLKDLILDKIKLVVNNKKYVVLLDLIIFLNNFDFIEYLVNAVKYKYVTTYIKKLAILSLYINLIKNEKTLFFLLETYDNKEVTYHEVKMLLELIDKEYHNFFIKFEKDARKFYDIIRPIYL